MNTLQDLLAIPLGEQEGQSHFEQRKVRLVGGLGPVLRVILSLRTKA